MIQNHLGTRVVSINLTDYEELYFCRLLLEKQVMSMVVAEISDESLEKAADILVQARNALKNENYLDILTLNTQFHEVFYHTCSNRRLVQMLENIRSLLLIYRANALKYLDYNREVTEEHGKILEAVQERDVNKAIEAVGTHVTNDMNRGRIIFTKKENSAESN
nr:GntR family transcriptional regulator [Halalkalibacter oceani]